MRIGVVGTESSHAEDFLRLINTLGRYPGHQIVAISGEEPEQARALAERFRVERVNRGPADMAAEIDAALIVTRHGGEHLDQVRPFVLAGLPVFIDKPLACSVADAESILALAAEAGSLVLSASALRWQQDTKTVSQRLAELGPTVELTATGTYFPESPYGGAFFYGIHAAEIALELTGLPTDTAVVERGPDGVAIRYQAGETRVVVRLVPPVAGDISFHVEALCAGGTLSAPIQLGEEYMAPVLDRFFGMIRTGQQPLSSAELLAPVRLIAV